MVGSPRVKNQSITMAKSSIHVRAATPGSESHNQRKKELSYVRSDLTHLNSSFKVCSIAERRKEISLKYQKTTGQKMQAISKPIREGVLLLDKKHNVEDLRKLGEKLEKEFGIKTIQAYVHKDEGHYDKDNGEWKPNLHGHMVLDWTQENGKAIRLNRQDLSKMQTIVAKELGMERGVSSDKRHIESKTFKSLKLSEEIEHKYGKEKLLKAVSEVAREGYLLKEAGKELKEENQKLKDERDMTKYDLDYIISKREEEAQKLQEIEKKKGQDRQLRI